MGSINGSLKDQGNEVNLMNVTAKKQIVPNKVPVTGASGLLGVAAIEKFLSAGWEVVSVSRRKPERWRTRASLTRCLPAVRVAAERSCSIPIPGSKTCAAARGP